MVMCSARRTNNDATDFQQCHRGSRLTLSRSIYVSVNVVCVFCVRRWARVLFCLCGHFRFSSVCFAHSSLSLSGCVGVGVCGCCVFFVLFFLLSIC